MKLVRSAPVLTKGIERNSWYVLARERSTPLCLLPNRAASSLSTSSRIPLLLLSTPSKVAFATRSGACGTKTSLTRTIVGVFVDSLGEPVERLSVDPIGEIVVGLVGDAVGEEFPPPPQLTRANESRKAAKARINVLLHGDAMEDSFN